MEQAPGQTFLGEKTIPVVSQTEIAAKLCFNAEWTLRAIWHKCFYDRN
jgi:hypothetical protein